MKKSSAFLVAISTCFMMNALKIGLGLMLLVPCAERLFNNLSYYSKREAIFGYCKTLDED
jgi:hypothetical protein